MPNILPGAPPTTGSGTPWGMVPQVPDPLSTANLAITGDIANLPSLQSLASQVNQFNTSQALQPYISNLPGYQGMVAQSSQNIGNLLQGQIPPDVIRLLQQQSAERGVGQGISGSPNQNAELLQALGLTSLGLQQQGEGELTQAIGRTPVPQLFNVAQFLTTPGEEQAAQMAANIYASAPDPNRQAQALIDLFTQFMGQLGGHGGQFTTPPNLNIPTTIPGGGATTYNPPTTVSGGGSPPPGAPPTSFWDWWKTNAPPNQSGGGGTTTGGASPNTGGGTTPGFSGGPSAFDWQGFMGGVNPGTTPGFSGGPAPDQWMGFLSALNQPNTPGFGGGPSNSDWQGFLGGLNPDATAANTWFGLTPDELEFLGQDSTQSIGSNNYNTYDPFTDSSVNLPDPNATDPNAGAGYWSCLDDEGNWIC